MRNESGGGLHTPRYGHLENSLDMRFSINSASQGYISGATFDKVSGVGVKHASISLSSEAPRSNTSVSINFTLTEDLVADDSFNSTATIVVHLPDFGKAYDDLRYLVLTNDLTVTGDFADHFTAYWSDSEALWPYTDSIILNATTTLEAGVQYTVTIADESQLDEGNTLFTSRFGLGAEHPLGPPQIWVTSSSGWTQTYTNLPIGTYPSVLGVYDLKVDLDLTRPKNKMTFFQLSVNVTRDINGPARIVLYLPQLTHDSKHYSEVAGPYYDIHQGGPSTQTWREYDKTLTIYREGGWPYDNGSIAFQVADIESFTMNSMGVPYCDNTPCDNNIRMWIEGHDNSGSITTPLEITNIPKVPMIQRSSMRFSPSIFSANATLTVTLQLNMPAKPGDEFLFNLPGVDGLYVANNRNYTIVGDCGSISPDRFLYNNDSVLRLTVANTTDQCRGVNGSQNGLTYFNWTVPAEAGLTAPQIVNQINTELYQINWKQTLRYNSSMYMDTGFVPVADAPLAGFTSSGISFTSPYGGYASDMVLKILTADTLEVEDVITVYLPYINVTAGSTFTLTDSWGNIWHATWMEGVYTEAGATWSNNHHELALTVPQRMRPTALAFTVPVNLPVEGIEGGAPDMYAYDVGGNSTFTIGLTRGADSLQPQYIQYVQPVGSIYSVQINAIAEERTKPGGNDYNETAANNIGRKRVTFTLTLVTSGALNVGDEITIDMLAYDFNFDAALHVSTGTASFSARANAAERQIVITVTRAQSRETMRSGVSLTIDPSDSVQVPLHFCDANGSDCPLTLSIASSSCPVANFTTYAVNDYYTLFTKIHLHTAGGVPTLFPTSQPTGQPTSSPSSQPSGSPTMVPSGQPTSAPTSPTGQPTSRPSAQPSVQPTAVPSSQPSGQPTGEPSGQPTRQPTGSPTSSPTTALATSVRLNIEQDLEGISAADFDDADADAFY